MRQHITKGRGAPLKIPSELHQHYIDLNTSEIYVSRGTEYVEDWGQPLLDKNTLDALLHEFEESLFTGDGLNSVQTVEVTDLGDRRVAYIELPAMAGRFVMVVDPTDNPAPFEIELRLPYRDTVRRGLEFKVYNATQSEPTLVHENDTIVLAGSVMVAPGIQIEGVVTVKYVSDRDSKRKWLVFGNTTRDAMSTVGLAANAAKLDGYTREQIIQEARLLAEDTKRMIGIDGADYTTEAELDKAFGDVVEVVDRLSSTI